MGASIFVGTAQSRGLERLTRGCQNDTATVMPTELASGKLGISKNHPRAGQSCAHGCGNHDKAIQTPPGAHELLSVAQRQHAAFFETCLAVLPQYPDGDGNHRAVDHVPQREDQLGQDGRSEALPAQETEGLQLR